MYSARISSDKRGETKRSYSNPGIKVVYASKNGKRVVSSGEGIIVDGYTGAIDGRNPRLGGARDIFRDMRGAVRGDTASFVDPLTGKRKKVTIPNIGYTKPHREFRISGQIRNPWVGKDRYRAATTKLSLNRSFKQRLPSLDHVTDKLDKTH